ncbi:hypothetical protein GC174_18300 [bacterium]|nr:hypothetical protein [bacterium]
MSMNQDNCCIGRLITELGWIPASKLEDLASIAYEGNQPLGRILLQHSYISPEELRNLIEAQALLRDQHISLAYAKRALAFSSWYRVSLENALPWVVPGDSIARVDYSRRLGQLLVASGCVDRITLENNLDVSRRVGVRLGELLKDRAQVSENMLSASLESQKLLRYGHISENHAIAGLQRINRGLIRYRAPSQKLIVPLGQLLVNSGILSRKNVDDALEVSRINGKPLGEVLKIFALLGDGMLDSALHLQRLLHTGSIKFAGASQALNHIYLNNVTVQEALNTVNTLSAESQDLSPAEFLLLTDVFPDKWQQLEFIANSGLPRQNQQSRLAEQVGNDLTRASVRLTYLMKHSILSIEQALIALHISTLTGLDIDAFLERVGWANQSTFERIGTGIQDRESKQRHEGVLCEAAA